MPSVRSRGEADVVDDEPAKRLGLSQTGHVPRAIVGPPDRRPCKASDPAEVVHHSGSRIDHVQLVGDGPRIDLPAHPADHCQRTAVWPGHQLFDVTPAEAVCRVQLAGNRVEQPQLAVAALLAPDDRVIALSALALVLLGRLVRGHHGDPAVRQRADVVDLAFPFGQALRLAAIDPDPVQLGGPGAV
jgi:hypothetical protein